MNWDLNWDTWYKPERALNVWSVFSNLRKGSVNVQIWDVFIWHDWFCWVFSSQSNPPGSPFTPKSSWALTLAALALKGELFSALAPRDPPLVPPTSTIPFSCRDNFIHPVHHCIQLNAETMPTLEWIELACVHVLTKAKKGRCDVFIFTILTENAPPWIPSFPVGAVELQFYINALPKQLHQGFPPTNIFIKVHPVDSWAF